MTNRFCEPVFPTERLTNGRMLTCITYNIWETIPEALREFRNSINTLFEYSHICSRQCRATVFLRNWVYLFTLFESSAMNWHKKFCHQFLRTLFYCNHSILHSSVPCTYVAQKTSNQKNASCFHRPSMEFRIFKNPLEITANWNKSLQAGDHYYPKKVTVDLDLIPLPRWTW